VRKEEAESILFYPHQPGFAYPIRPNSDPNPARSSGNAAFFALLVTIRINNVRGVNSAQSAIPNRSTKLQNEKSRTAVGCAAEGGRVQKGEPTKLKIAPACGE
jgi:hypothetical protein